MLVEWESLFQKGNKPEFDEIGSYVNNHMWEEINIFLNTTYHISPTLEYSGCSMQKGWNVKYKKSGRNLCVLYPESNGFKVLVVVSERDIVEVELYIETCSDYIKRLYYDIKYFNGSKWLMIQIYDLDILKETIGLIKIKNKWIKTK